MFEIIDFRDRKNPSALDLDEALGTRHWRVPHSTTHLRGHRRDPMQYYEAFMYMLFQATVVEKNGQGPAVALALSDTTINIITLGK